MLTLLWPYTIGVKDLKSLPHSPGPELLLGCFSVSDAFEPPVPRTECSDSNDGQRPLNEIEQKPIAAGCSAGSLSDLMKSPDYMLVKTGSKGRN